jgi:hypothetical protein
MNQQLYEIKESNTPFVKELLTDINRSINIKKNADMLILTRKLVEYNLCSYVKEEDLPHQTIIGSSYLIKNNSVFAFENMFTYEKFNILLPHSELIYKSIMNVYNLDINDVCGVQNEYIFAGMSEEISYSPSSVVRFMLMLINDFGFKIYIKKSMNR